MKLEAMKLAIASAIVFAVLWVVCSLFVFAMPFQMMQMTGHMAHADFNHMGWQLNPAGFLYGLLAWSLSAGFVTGAIASLYNRLIG